MPMSINRYSKTAVAVIQKAAAEPDYLHQLLQEPSKALASHALSEDERAALSDSQSLKALVAEANAAKS